MEIQEALKILDQVCATYQGVRADHVALQQAMQVVTAAITPPPEAKPKKKETDGNK